MFNVGCSMRIRLCGLAMLVAVTASADVVKMSSGNQIECIVIQENPDSIVIRRAYGTMTLPRAQIASITKSPVLTASDVAPTTQPAAGQRIPPWSNVLAVLVKSTWASNLQQIPATVIDVGVMKHVPYQSYRCGADYEVNIYGDLDHPASIEIGIYRSLLNSAEAKRNCIEFIASVLTDKADAGILRTMNQTKDLVTRNDLSIEITPPTDPDAYGGWWVSVYNEKELDAARASDAELKQITVAKDTPVPAPAAAAVTPTGSASAVASSRTPTAQPAPAPAVSDAWSPSDMGYARSRSSSSSGGGSVYVRSYTRRDGTYVHSYTRRR